MGKNKSEIWERTHIRGETKYERNKQTLATTKRGRQQLDEEIEKRLTGGNTAAEIVSELSVGKSRLATRKTMQRHVREVQQRLNRLKELKLAEEERLLAKQEAFSKHFEDLCGLAKQWHEQLDIPICQLLDPANSFIRDRANPSFSLDQVSDTEVSVRLSIEKELLFLCLQEHLRDSPIWEFFSQWKAAIVELTRSLKGLCNLVANELELAKQRWLTLDEWEQGESGLLPQFSKTIVADACQKAAKGWSSWTETYSFNPHPKCKGREALFLEGALVTFALAASASRDELEHYRDLHLNTREWLRSQPQIAEFKERYQKMSEQKIGLQTELERIQLKRTFPGKCSLCP